MAADAAQIPFADREPSGQGLYPLKTDGIHETDTAREWRVVRGQQHRAAGGVLQGAIEKIQSFGVDLSSPLTGNDRVETEEPDARDIKNPVYPAVPLHPGAPGETGPADVLRVCKKTKNNLRRPPLVFLERMRKNPVGTGLRALSE